MEELQAASAAVGEKVKRKRGRPRKDSETDSTTPSKKGKSAKARASADVHNDSEVIDISDDESNGQPSHSRKKTHPPANAQTDANQTD